MFSGGLRRWGDPLIDRVLGRAHANPSIAGEQLVLLPWALVSVASVSPTGLGLAGRASYSGPGATSLLGNLAHSTRAGAYAAELIVAACLVYRGWSSTDGQMVLGDVREAGGRLDFGAKLVGTGTARRTCEADVLVSFDGGRRLAVDVKYSAAGVYRSRPTASMLEVVGLAIKRGEIESFHFVTPGRFRPAFHAAVAGVPGVVVHERVWPTPEDRARIAVQERAAIDHSRLVADVRVGGVVAFDVVAARLAQLAGDAYRDATAGQRDLVDVRRPTGWTYLFDATIDEGVGAPPRLVATWGQSTATVRQRDKRFMAGFPLPKSPSDLDRGHAVAREAGGDEGIGINLIPQDRKLNQGRGPGGRRWRRLERLAASQPGTGVFVRQIYDDDSDLPAWLEFFVVTVDGDTILERFRNRPGAP